MEVCLLFRSYPVSVAAMRFGGCVILLVIKIAFTSVYLFGVYMEDAETDVTQTADDFTCVGFAHWISRFYQESTL